MKLRAPLRTFTYLTLEIIPSFLLGIFIFVLIVMMFQTLRLVEFALIHGVEMAVIAELASYMALSFTPALLPMSVLFAVLLSYGRLSNDSEIVALKTCGLSLASIGFPAVVLGLVTSILSYQVSTELSPLANRRFEVLLTELGSTKAGTTIKPGVFAEGFFNLVVYASGIDSKTNELKNVFIYDDTRGDSPLTILASRGQIIQNSELPGHEVLLRLFDGAIHRKTTSHTKVNFDSFDLKLFDPIQFKTREKSAQSLSALELRQKLSEPKLESEKRLQLLIESTKRKVVATACLVLALLGVGLGSVSNLRSQRVSGFVLCILSVIAFWITYLVAEGLVRNLNQPEAHHLLWIPILVFSGYAFKKLREAWY